MRDSTRYQITLVQIDNYGPWTITPTPRREADLQTMQSRLYADLSQLIGVNGGYVFFTRFDNMIAVTNGLDQADHEWIQTSIGTRYPVTVSMGIATNESPVDALGDATTLLQTAGSAQDDRRRSILRGAVLEEADRGDSDVEIAHFDVNDATTEYTDQLNAYDAFLHIERAYSTLAGHLRSRHGALAFFVGGDNIIAVCPHLSTDAYSGAIEEVRGRIDVDLKAGIGRGRTALEAGMGAKSALERCRHNSTRIERTEATLGGEPK